jgi:hypothetical protein
MKFRELLESYIITDEFKLFIDKLTDYMDLYDKSSINEIYDLAVSLDLIQKKSKVFRVQCTIDGEPINSKQPLISTSTVRLKGAVLDGVIEDMKFGYKQYKNVKECDISYIEYSNVVGIDLVKLANFVLKNKEHFEDYIDVFKRLKSEKEFLTVNKNLNIKNIEKLDV